MSLLILSFLHWFIPPFGFASGLVLPVGALAVLLKGIRL